ncbi:MAG: PH domain-containing protein [Myxococcales bacterium]|nr:PH domain-containing protein [Myxococcales bacterium]MCB9581194.1 PH domain-containing protein [Polyangiaceae bacterium]
MSAEAEQVLFAGRPALLPGLGTLLLVIFTLGLALPVLWFRRQSKSYKITTQRVVIETGLLSKSMEQIDLYRITDYVVERPFSQRILGTGNLILETMDKTTPEVHLDALSTNVVALYERLRAATETEKLRRGVRVVDYE